jgi:hypothetical protein
MYSQRRFIVYQEKMSAIIDKSRQEKSCGTGFNVKVWCNRDPCGSICACLSWFLILYAECTVVVCKLSTSVQNSYAYLASLSF